MVPACERIREAAQDFDIAVADTNERLEAAFRLRHQVYCIERGFEPGDGAQERDQYDSRSRHVILTQRSTGRVVGTVRVVSSLRDGGSADLPMQKLCPPNVFRMLPLDSTGEISRFSISKDLRDVSCASNAMLRLGLMRGILQISREMNLTHWCAIMEHTLLRLLRLSAIHFEPLGPAIEFRGLRQPSWGAIDAVLARIKRDQPAFWNYVTDDGTLAREPAESSEALFA